MVSKKREDEKTEHIERRQTCNNVRKDWQKIMTAQTSKCKGPCKDLIFAQETRSEWNSRNRQRKDEKRPERDGHSLPQTTHVPNVLRITMMITCMVKGMMHCIDHGSRPEKKSSLEPRMRHQMKHPC